jgi:hypothetical protein
LYLFLKGTYCEYILEEILSTSEVRPILALMAPSPLVILFNFWFTCCKKRLNYLAFQSFDFQHTWWRLLQSFDFQHLMEVIPIFWLSSYLMKVIPIFWLSAWWRLFQSFDFQHTWWRLLHKHTWWRLLHKHTWWRLFQSFDFQHLMKVIPIFWFSAYLMKVIPIF